MKVRWILSAVCVGLIAVLVAFPGAQADKPDGAHEHGLGCIEGTWILSGRPSRETLFLGHNGQTIHFASSPSLPPDTTLGGLFPNATFDLTGPTRGSGVRTGPRTFEFKAINYAVNVVDGIRSEIAYIRILAGTVDFPDCDTQEVILTASFYLPEQDANGDGIPDEGEEPFLSIPDLPVRATKFFP